MAELLLSRGKVALVDDKNFEWLNQWKWTYGTNGYAYRSSYNKKNPSGYLHRYILQAPTEKEVDHINGDRLDNRRSNLRLVSRKQNSLNLYRVRSKSGHKGVYWSHQNKKWNAQIGIDGRSTSLGFFDNISDAIKKRKEVELALFNGQV